MFSPGVGPGGGPIRSLGWNLVPKRSIFRGNLTHIAGETLCET